MRTAYKITLSPVIKDNEKIKWENFLVDVLLNNLQYNMWFNKNVKKHLLGESK